ncbi:MAG TPA: phosphoribosyltransferase [Candidatus Limnocylindrales bacterium]|nr:phosphoribosyltransferase [Candidatus Limnocylindrales bacterium]
MSPIAEPAGTAASDRPTRFRDREEAGAYLAEQLRRYGGRSDVLVLAIPRGGVPVAFQIAGALQAPLDVLVVRKLGVPEQPELAMGAIASGGIRVLNRDVVDGLRLPESVIDAVTRREEQELERRERVFRGHRQAIDPAGRTVILVDDGLATGSTMRAAIASLRQRKPARLIVAVPVAATPIYRAIGPLADEILCPIVSDFFFAVGQWYDNFSQTTDAEVRDLLREAKVPVETVAS